MPTDIIISLAGAKCMHGLEGGRKRDCVGSVRPLAGFRAYERMMSKPLLSHKHVNSDAFVGRILQSCPPRTDS